MSLFKLDTYDKHPPSEYVLSYPESEITLVINGESGLILKHDVSVKDYIALNEEADGRGISLSEVIMESLERLIEESK